MGKISPFFLGTGWHPPRSFLDFGPTVTCVTISSGLCHTSSLELCFIPPGLGRATGAPRRLILLVPPGIGGPRSFILPPPTEAFSDGGLETRYAWLCLFQCIPPPSKGNPSLLVRFFPLFRQSQSAMPDLPP